jgi:transglutaminase-like putative cysteine protease
VATAHQDPAFGPYLTPTRFIESEHPEVVAFAQQRVGDARTDRERAVRLFYAVRDEVRYDPYVWHANAAIFKASYTLRRSRTFCIPKAILLAAASRALGIPSRLAFADVRNHLATERLLALLKTDVFAFHGYTELYLGGRWVKATPTFNLSLCEKFGVKPLEFDGEHDATLHPFDRQGQRHMEYLRDRGSYADLPLADMVQALREHYPHLFGGDGDPFRLAAAGGDFEKEATEENP